MLALLTSLALLGQPTDMPVTGLQDQQDPPRYNRYRTYQLKDLEIADLKVKVPQKEGEPKVHKFQCWVMDSYGKRQEGMMFLNKQDVSDSQGMIFVFKKPEVQSFWMKNTYIPLDIAYIDKDGKIVKTYTMRPLDTYTDYTSVKEAQYVLEVNGGVFKKLGIEAGQTFDLPKTLKAKN